MSSDPGSVDVLKVAALIIAIYGAVLSSVNFIITWIGYVSIEILRGGYGIKIADVTITGHLNGKYIDKIEVQNNTGSTLKTISVSSRLSRGDCMKIEIRSDLLSKGEKYRFVVFGGSGKILYSEYL